MYVYIKIYKSIHEHIHSYFIFKLYFIYFCQCFRFRVHFYVSVSVPFIPHLQIEQFCHLRGQRSISWLTLGSEFLFLCFPYMFYRLRANAPFSLTPICVSFDHFITWRTY